MYSQKFCYAQEQIQPDYEPVTDENFELRYGSCPAQFFGSQQQPWTPGLCSEPLGRDSMGPAKSSSTTMMSRFESPASAFYAAERCMRFPEYGSLRPDSDSEFPLYRSSCDGFSISSGDPSDHRSCEREKLAADRRALSWRQVSVPKEARDCKVSGNSYGLPPLQRIIFTSQQEKQPLGHSSGSNSSASPSGTFSMSTGSVLPNKTRIRWTQDLHEKFVECVNRLGGAEKATPKAILKFMDSDGLTIFHIKSHLQKYRIAKYIPDSAEGKNERRTSLSDAPRLDLKGCLQIKEALQLQLDVQRQLHEQLEIQRKLQLRIEEQGKQLRMMFEQQQKTTEALLSNQNNTGLEDDHFQEAEDSENTHFPSKIS